MTNKHIIYLAFFCLLIGLFSTMNLLELRAMEPIRALVTMEMMINGNHIYPTLTGVPYLHKPPFFNWVLETSFRLTGSFQEWAVRLPSTIAYLLTGLLMFFGLRPRLGERVAGLAAIFFLFSADLLFYGTVNGGEMDLFLPLPVFAQVIVLPLFYEKRRFLAMFVCSYALMATVFLTKHFAAFAIHALAILTLVVSDKDWRVLFRWQHFAGIGVFLAIVGVYFFTYSQQHELEPFLANLFLETTDKSHSHGLVKRLLHLVELPFIFIKLLLPWSLLVFFLWKKKVWEVFRQDNVLRYSFIFSLFNVGLYWLMGEPHDRYLYPLFPFFCIVLAVIFDKFTKLKFRMVAWVALVLAITRIVYNVAVMPLQQQSRQDRKAAFEMLKLAGEEPIFLTGWEVVRSFDKELLGKKILSAEVRYPAPIPYGIPYIITRETGRIVQFHPKPESGKLYLAPAVVVENLKKEVLYKLEVDYLPGGFLLCRIE